MISKLVGVTASSRVSCLPRTRSQSVRLGGAKRAHTNRSEYILCYTVGSHSCSCCPTEEKEMALTQGGSSGTRHVGSWKVIPRRACEEVGSLSAVQGSLTVPEKHNTAEGGSLLRWAGDSPLGAAWAAVVGGDHLSRPPSPSVLCSPSHYAGAPPLVYPTMVISSLQMATQRF